MATYMYQCAYTPEAWAKMSKNPQDRIAAVTPVVEAAGGKVVGGWFCFGEYDVVAIFEMPDNASMASVAVAFATGGALKAAKTTPMFTPAEAVEVLAGAGKLTYKPPTA